MKIHPNDLADLESVARSVENEARNMAKLAIRIRADLVKDAADRPEDPTVTITVHEYAALNLLAEKATEGAIAELSKLTFVVQHNPNCPSPWLVRLPGKGPIDMLPYGDGLGIVAHQTGDFLGFGKTFEEAARAALAKGGDA